MLLKDIKEQIALKKVEIEMKQNDLAELESALVKEESYLQLNDLYLDIQKGKVKLTRKVYDTMYSLLWKFEHYGTMMFDWWEKEFRRLPGWLNV